MDECIKKICGMYTQWNSIPPQKREHPAIYENMNEL